MPAAAATKKDRWFQNRHWRVCTELTGERTLDGATIHYQDGHFTIDPPHTFQTPLGHLGRQGIIVAETDADGNDLDAPRQAFGEQTLRTAAEVYGTVHGLT